MPHPGNVLLLDPFFKTSLGLSSYFSRIYDDIFPFLTVIVTNSSTGKTFPQFLSLLNKGLWRSCFSFESCYLASPHSSFSLRILGPTITFNLPDTSSRRFQTSIGIARVAYMFLTLFWIALVVTEGPLSNRGFFQSLLYEPNHF